MARCLLISGTELAQMLGMHFVTIWKQVASGSIPQPIRRPGSRPRWRRREIEAWIEDDMPTAAEWEARKHRHLRGVYIDRLTPNFSLVA